MLTNSLLSVIGQVNETLTAREYTLALVVILLVLTGVNHVRRKK
jgi:hypothetical protein